MWIKKGVEEKKPFYVVGVNVSWYSHYGKQYEYSPHKTPYAPAYGIYLDKITIQEDACTSMFIEITIYNSEDR